MYISQKKKEENIGEYILYMWQIEDIIRSCQCSIEIIEKNIIEKFTADLSGKEELKKWYRKLISSMEEEKILQKGHFDELNYILKELSFLHNSLINIFQDKKYIGLYNNAHSNILALQKKTAGANPGDIETCLTGLYGLFLLKLQKKVISIETSDAMKTFSTLLSYLSLKYKEMKKGGLLFPDVIQN